MPKKLILDEETIFKKNPDIQDIKTDEGIIISSANLKDESIYYLDNSVSRRIWNLIDGENPLSKIRKVLSSEYAVDENTLAKDLKSFVKDLYLKKLIIKIK